jgi:putative colanic acid biosynthesis UDP-glucose lipid carrier transferase
VILEAQKNADRNSCTEPAHNCTFAVMSQIIKRTLTSIKALGEQVKIFPKFFHYFLASYVLDIMFCYLLIAFVLPEYNWLLIIGIWLVASFIKYPKIRERRYVRYVDILRLTVIQLAIFLAICFAIYTVDIGLISDVEMLDVLWVSLSLIFSKMTFVYIVRWYRKSGYGYNRFLMIGNPEELQVIAKLIEDQQYSGCQLDGILSSLPDFDELENRITSNALNEIYCSAEIKDYVWLSELLNLASKYGVSLYIVSDANQFKNWRSITSINREVLDGTMHYFPLLDRRNIVIKRIFDFIVSFIVTVTILSWMIPIIGLFIRLESKGPIFFLQARAGKGGKLFKCIKFRSMRPSQHFEQAKKGDHRVTKVGAFLRKTSLDEFPQFINVLLGQMSVVGPRPHVKQLNDQFNKNINNYDDRLLVKQGITGLSQIMGHRGETRDVESMADRIRVDLSYIKNWTLWMDIKIIFKTIIQLFVKRENAY